MFLILNKWVNVSLIYPWYTYSFRSLILCMVLTFSAIYTGVGSTTLKIFIVSVRYLRLTYFKIELCYTSTFISTLWVFEKTKELITLKKWWNCYNLTYLLLMCLTNDADLIVFFCYIRILFWLQNLVIST